MKNKQTRLPGTQPTTFVAIFSQNSIIETFIFDLINHLQSSSFYHTQLKAKAK
jgi:hypothetical protein